MTTTTVTIAGRTAEAGCSPAGPGSGESTLWIDGRAWLEDLISERVAALLRAELAVRAAAGVRARDIVDAAMRVQRMIDRYWRLSRITCDDGVVSGQGPAGQLSALAGAVDAFLEELPGMVEAAAQ